MAFPQKTFFGFPKGWKDRGRVNPIGKISCTCKICGYGARVGIEDGKPFRYCSTCLTKI